MSAATPTTPPKAPSQEEPPQEPPPAETKTPRTLRIATRSSALALAQVTLFTTLLSETATRHPSTQTPLSQIPTSTHPLSTSLGDTNKTLPLATLSTTSGGKSLWTDDLETLLLAHGCDIIVHSLKDVPTALREGCRVRGVGIRGEKRDCVVVREGLREEVRERGLGGLPAGAVVGTSSVRRAAMVRRLWPGLVVRDLRGNVPTRVGKVERGEVDAIVVAGAGVLRLGMGGRVDAWLGRGEGFLAAVGQGAIGVEWLRGDEWVTGVVEGLGWGGRGGWEGVAEREVLRVLEGGCSVPLGVECEWENGGEGGGGEGPGWLVLRGMVVSPDGSRCVEAEKRHWVDGDGEAERCGGLLAKELVERGAGEILGEINRERGKGVS